MFFRKLWLALLEALSNSRIDARHLLMPGLYKIGKDYIDKIV